MTIKIGWLTPFSPGSGVGTFSKAITDEIYNLSDEFDVDCTIISVSGEQNYSTNNRFIDIKSISSKSMIFDIFDILIYNVGNNVQFHGEIFEILREHPGVVICHDYTYQHFIAGLIQHNGSNFCDYAAVLARYGDKRSLRFVQESGVTGSEGLRISPWDTDFCVEEPLGAPIMRMGSAVVVHSKFAEDYAQRHFSGPVLRLGMPYGQKYKSEYTDILKTSKNKTQINLLSFGHVQATKFISEIIHAISSDDILSSNIKYTVSGFCGDYSYLHHLNGLVPQLGLSKKISFRIDISDEELQELSERADLFINLRRPNTEGASVSLIEQLETGKPVLIIPTGCYAEVPDDAAFKVAPPFDVAAIAAALRDALERQEEFEAIGRRGRAFAQRYDCAGYAKGLLEFARHHEKLLRRRSRVKATRNIDQGPLSIDRGDIDDQAWNDELAEARSTFDHLDRGTLHLSADIIRSLRGYDLADYVLSVFIRSARNENIRQIIHDFFDGKSDPYFEIRRLVLAKNLAKHTDDDNVCLFKKYCDVRDMSFWKTLSVIGADVIEVCAHQAFFSKQPPSYLFPGPGRGLGSGLYHRALAASLMQRRSDEPASYASELDNLITWLRDDDWGDVVENLRPVSRGDTVRVGSEGWTSRLCLQGFHEPEPDHVWSNGAALMLVNIDHGIEKIQIYGNSIDDDMLDNITISATIGDKLHHFKKSLIDGVDAFAVSIEKANYSDLAIYISVSSCRSPAELGRSLDPRPLGFCLREIQFL